MMASPPENAGDDTQRLLSEILSQLKLIGDRIAEQNEPPRFLTPSPQPYSTRRDSRASAQLDAPPPPPWTSLPFREGPLLTEALRRYRHNAIPRWSTFYGGHVGPGPLLSPGSGTVAGASNGSPERPEEAARNLEWEALTGKCFRVPHDNRVGLCFMAGVSDGEAPRRLERWLRVLHGRRNEDAPRGRSFNVWDWFDGGLSAYWYPGRAGGVESLDRRLSVGVVGEEGRRKGRDMLSPLIAPWRRVINIQGLTTMDKGSGMEDFSDLSDLELCPVLLAQTRDAIFQHPINDMLWKVVRCHLRCQRVTETHHSEFRSKGCVVFHVTFYEILGRTECDDVVELWPCGLLHSDETQNGGQGRRIRESAVTAIAVPGAESPGPSPRSIFWTLLFLRPEGFPHPYYFERQDDLSQGTHHEMIDDVADVVHKILIPILERWEDIAECFDDLLGEKKALLDPDYHDSLLSDDAHFSRSKRYFWAIEFLKEAEKSVGDNVRQTERFLEGLRESPPGGGGSSREYRVRVRKLESVVKRLEGLRGRFLSIKDEAVALRDGLFNASAVMESRTSTKLGENIKLLTFVSIFFLPLSFCTSLWSISDDLFSLNTLGIVMPLMAIFTYAVVLSIDGVAAFFANVAWRPWVSLVGAPLGRVQSVSDLKQVMREYGRGTSRWLQSWKPIRNLVKPREMLINPRIDPQGISVDVQVDVESGQSGVTSTWMEGKGERHMAYLDRGVRR